MSLSLANAPQFSQGMWIWGRGARIYCSSLWWAGGTDAPGKSAGPPWGVWKLEDSHCPRSWNFEIKPSTVQHKQSWMDWSPTKTSDLALHFGNAACAHRELLCAWIATARDVIGYGCCRAGEWQSRCEGGSLIIRQMLARDRPARQRDQNESQVSVGSLPPCLNIRSIGEIAEAVAASGAVALDFDQTSPLAAKSDSPATTTVSFTLDFLSATMTCLLFATSVRLAGQGPRQWDRRDPRWEETGPTVEL